MFAKGPEFITVKMLDGMEKPGLKITDSMVLALRNVQRDGLDPLVEYEKRVFDVLQTEEGQRLVVEGWVNGVQALFPLGTYGENGPKWTAPASIFENEDGQTVIHLHYF